MRYEKGRKEASRRRIIEVASDRFRSDGIAATGLAGIMSDAGLTNGAFYPHFQSKAELVRDSVAAALDAQSQQIQELLASGGPEMAIQAYLSAEHRDNPNERYRKLVNPGAFSPPSSSCSQIPAGPPLR